MPPEDDDFLIEDDSEEVEELSQDDSDALEESRRAAVSGEPEPDATTRLDKKRERLNLREEAERARRERDAVVQQNQQYAHMIQQSLARQQQPQAPAAQAHQGPADWEKEVRGIYSEIEQVSDLYMQMQASGKLTAEKGKELKQKVQDLHLKQQVLIAKNAGGGQPQQQVDPQQLAQQTLQMAFQQESQRAFPDVHSNPQAMRYALGEFNRLTAMGHPDSPQTHQRAMLEARKAFYGTPGGNGQSGPPSAHRQGRYTSVPNGARGVGKEPVRIKMTPEMKKVAEATYPDLPAKKAHQMHVKKIGRRFIEDERRAGRG